MLLKELLQETVTVKKTNLNGIPFYDLPKGIENFDFEQPGPRKIQLADLRKAVEAANKDGYIIFPTGIWHEFGSDLSVWHRLGRFNNKHDAVQHAKKRKANGEKVAIVRTIELVTTPKGNEARDEFWVPPHKTSPVVKVFENSETPSSRICEQVDDDTFHRFIMNDMEVEEVTNIFHSFPPHGVFYSPHPVLKMRPDWESNKKDVAFVEDIAANPDKYVQIRPYTGGSAHDWWDDVVIVQRAGLKMYFKDLNNQFSREPDLAEEIVDDINNAFAKNHITNKMTLGKYMKLADGPYSMVEKSGAGYLIYSMEND